MVMPEPQEPQDGKREQQFSDNEPQGIEIPEEYKDKGWIANKKFESVNDLFKEIDELQSLKGKKTVPIDFDNADEEEIKKYFEQITPKEIKAYDWKDPEDENGEYNFTDEEKEIFGKAFQEAGLSKYQGNKLIETMINRREEINKKLYDKEGFENALKEIFKEEDDWKKTAGETANSLKQILGDDAKKLDGVPNDVLALIYKVHHQTIKDYAINEGKDRGTGGQTGNSQEDIEAKRTELRNKIDSLRFKQGAHKELETLNKQLLETYQNDPRIKKQQ